MWPAFTCHRPRPSPLRRAFYYFCRLRRFNKRKTFELFKFCQKKARYLFFFGTMCISFVVCQNICLGEIFLFYCCCCFLTILRVQHAKCVEWRKALKRRLHYKLTELWPKKTKNKIIITLGFEFRRGVVAHNESQWKLFEWSFGSYFLRRSRRLGIFG